MGRNKCVIKKAAASPQKVMPHTEFIDRIRKSFYFGGETFGEDMERGHGHVTRPLAEYASEIFSEPHKGHSLNRLNSVAVCMNTATPCSLIMALIYLDRLNISDPGYVRRITPQELFVVSMMISTKFYAGHDEEIYLSDWAEDGNMSEDRLKQLELEFLCAIDWNIYISNELFFAKLTSIEKTLAQREGLRRGWLTYTELVQMLPSFTIAKFLLNNITIMAVSYAASVMTIAGAFFLASQIPGTILHRKTVSNSVTVTATGETVLSEMPPTDLLTEDGLASPTKNATATIVTIATSTQRNATCNALNVEVELLKLERQYREEALRDALRLRQNEITSESRLMLPEAPTATWQQKNALASSSQRYQPNTQQNWLTFKTEYSDRLTAEQQFQHIIRNNHGDRSSYPSFDDCVTQLGNCTSAIFWLQSFVRLPLMWFKFM